MQVKVLGAERRRRWSYDEKVRLVEETFQSRDCVRRCAPAWNGSEPAVHVASAGAVGPPRRRGYAGSCSRRDHIHAGSGVHVRIAAVILASCATREGRDNRDRD